MASQWPAPVGHVETYRRRYRPSNATVQVAPSSLEDSQTWLTTTPPSWVQVIRCLSSTDGSFPLGARPSITIASSSRPPSRSSTPPVESIQVWCQQRRASSYALMLRPSTPPLPCQCSCTMPLPNIDVMVLVPRCLPCGP